MQHANPEINDSFVIEQDTAAEVVAALKDREGFSIYIYNRSNIAAIKALPCLEYTDIVIAESLDAQHISAIPQALQENIVILVRETQKRKFDAIIPTIEITEAELKSSVSPYSRQPQDDRFLTVPKKTKTSHRKAKRQYVLFKPDPRDLKYISDLSEKNMEQSIPEPIKKGPQHQ